MDNGSIVVYERCVLMTAYVTHDGGDESFSVIVAPGISMQRRISLMHQFLALVDTKAAPFLKDAAFSWGVYMEETIVSSRDYHLADYVRWSYDRVPIAKWSLVPRKIGGDSNG